jgi:hypothetical protein
LCSRQSCPALAERLRLRRDEIEAAILTRVTSLTDEDWDTSFVGVDLAYSDGLREAVGAALDYGLDTMLAEKSQASPVPVPLLVQARRAVRYGVGLNTVLRRYVLGYTLLSDFVIEEAHQGSHSDPDALQRLVHTLPELLDVVITGVAAEYERERLGRRRTSEQQLADQVDRLLGGEMSEMASLGYPIQSYHHIGIVAVGEAGPAAMREIARGLDRRVLTVSRAGGLVWGWMGSRNEIDPMEPEDLLAAHWPDGLHLAVGEPGSSLAGWRTTHLQAKAALAIAVRGPKSTVRYRDVAVAASLLKDSLLATSLHDDYLSPLIAETDGPAMRRTLRAYFDAGMNASAAAASLGISRRTVTSRLRTSEKRLGRSLESSYVEIELALRLEELTAHTVRTGR